LEDGDIEDKTPRLGLKGSDDDDEDTDQEFEEFLQGKNTYFFF